MAAPLIPPYSINSPLNTGLPVNLLFSDVWQGTLTLPVVSLGNTNATASLIYLNQSGYTFQTRITDPTLRFVKQAYTAGTAGVYTLGFGAVAPVVGQTYILKFFSGSATNQWTAQVQATASTTNASDLVTALNNAITSAQISGYITAAISGSTNLVITEVSATTGGITTQFLGNSNSTYTVTTANVQPFGTVAQVALYKPSVTSGTFNLYQWSYEAKMPNFTGSGTSTLMNVLIQIWVDTGAVNYATADTQLQQFQTGTYWSATYSTTQLNAWLGLPQ